MRIGVATSMHSNVGKISLDYLADELLKQIALKKPSPDMKTFRAEQNALAARKKNLIASIDDANKVKHLECILRYLLSI